MLTTLPKLNKILEIAESYNGIYEGSEAHHHLVDFYNTLSPLPRGYHLKYSDSWCAAYVSVVMRRSGILEFPYECGVFELYKKLIKKGCVVQGRFPMPGEILFFKSSHVGIVNGWIQNNFTVSTIEGNTSDMCAHRRHNLLHKNILGWASPYRYNVNEIQKQLDGNVWGDSETASKLLYINGY